jgi:hypothetical protein
MRYAAARSSQDPERLAWKPKYRLSADGRTPLERNLKAVKVLVRLIKDCKVMKPDQFLRVFFSDNTDLIILPKRLSLARFSANVALLNSCSRINF